MKRSRTGLSRTEAAAASSVSTGTAASSSAAIIPPVVNVSSCAETLTARRQAMLSKRRAAEELDKAKPPPVRKKPKKEAPPPPWTEADKDIFFQALLSCGKDFDKLHKQCLHKMKHPKEEGRGERTKDQIRHFYYRTLRNLMNMLDFDRISKNKEANELFSIINFGEFRRRTDAKHAILVKYCDKLKQLIYTGETKLKYKGKTIKIRTPTCAPLQGLMARADEQKDSDKKKKAKVPDMISIEVQPRDNSARQRVSDVSHNPNLRLKVKSEQCLSTVIEMLEKKWAPDSSKYRKALKLEDEQWNRLPHIKVYPAKSVKLQSFELSGFNPKPSTITSFDEYLRIHNEGLSNTNSTSESGDPVSFLKTKLQNITSQISDAAQASGTTIKDKTKGEHVSQSNELFRNAIHGWSAETSKGLYMGHLHLLFGAPDKILLDYEWPELKHADEMIHIFAGMITKLLGVAEIEFTSQQTRKRQASTPSSHSSPTSRSRKQSPNNHKGTSPSTPKTRNILPSPKNTGQTDSPEFKKPFGVPLQSENRQLATAIALGKQELKPHGRNGARPAWVQKNIMPKSDYLPYQIITTPRDKTILPKGGQPTSSGSTQVLDVSDILPSMQSSHARKSAQNTTSVISDAPTSMTFSTANTSTSSIAVTQSSNSRINCQQVKALLASHGTDLTTNTALINSLTQLFNNQKPIYVTPATQSSATESQFTRQSTDQTSNVETAKPDLLSLAMDALKTPKKSRRIPLTPVLSDIGDGSKDSFKLSTSTSDHQHVQLQLPETPVNNSEPYALLDPIPDFTNLHDDSNGDKTTLDVLLNEKTFNSSLNGRQSPNKDTWLNQGSINNSLFNLLNEPSDSNGGVNTTTVMSGALPLHLPNNTLDDTRESFLNNVGELGLDSTLHTMLNESSMDFTSKFESLAAALETPQKKS